VTYFAELVSLDGGFGLFAFGGIQDTARLAELGEFAFEPFHHRASNETGGVKRGPENRHQLLLELFVGRYQIQKWNMSICNHSVTLNFE